MTDNKNSILRMRPKDILLYNSKKYEKVKQSFEEGTYKAEQLRKISQMTINCERFNDYLKKYQKYGLILVMFSFIHVVMLAITVLTAEFLLYVILLFALAMTWYSFYSKKTIFTYVAAVSCVLGLILDIAMGFRTSFMVWGLTLTAVIIGLSPVITSLNCEYIYLSKQEGYPHFMYILDEEVKKNKKALAEGIERHYVTLEAPEDKKGKMDELEELTETIESLPDQRNDLMDAI